MNALEVLTRARSRIENRDHWTTGTWARDKRSRAVDPLSRRAVRWCAVGAVFAEAEAEDRTAWMLLTQASLAHFDSMASHVNDGEGGHAAVLALYDKAIARAEAEGVP